MTLRRGPEKNAYGLSGISAHLLVTSVRGIAVILEVRNSHYFDQSFYYDLIRVPAIKIIKSDFDCLIGLFVSTNFFLFPVNKKCPVAYVTGLALYNGGKHGC